MSSTLAVAPARSVGPVPFRILVLLALLTGPGCGVRDPVSDLARNYRWQRLTPPPPPAQPLAPRLRLLIWRDYLDPEVLAYFARTYGVALEITYFENNSELKQRFAAAPADYDLIMPSDYVVDRLIKQGLLAPLNKARVPNLGYVTPIFFRSPYDRELVYSVPLFYSTLGVVFNSEYLRHIPRTFRLQSPNHEENLLLHGYRALLDEPRVSLTAALMDDGHGPNDATAATLAQVTDRLIGDTKALGLRFLASDLPKAVENNQITLAVCWSGAAGVALFRNPSIRFVLPDGPNVVQVDSFVIPRTSPHQATAEFFLNFLLIPEISGALVNFSVYASTNIAARPFINREILLGPAYIEPSATSRILFADLGPLEDEFEQQWQRLRQSRPPISAKVPLRQSRGEEVRQQDLVR